MEFEILEQEVYAEQLPFLERLQISWDFNSQIKCIWLTGYILVAWEFDGFWDVFWRTLSVSFYKSGSYG